MKFKKIFGDKRIVGLAGDKSTGKTNNLMALIKDFREHNKTTNIYVFGLNEITLTWLNKLGNVYEVSSLTQLSNKKDSLIVLDEFQLLKINDKRNKDRLDQFVDFIYHNNNWLVLTTPSLREFNSIIGSKIERWLLKSLNINSLVNGSQIKSAVENYKGCHKSLDYLDIPHKKILIINEEYEQSVEVEHIKEIDNKLKNINIFDISKKSEKKSNSESKEKSGD